MSFILDALKKSESDRQRQSGPSLFEVKVARPRRTLPVWAVAIAVLLGINAIVVSWMLLRHPAAQQPAAAASAEAAPIAAPGSRAAAQDTASARLAVNPPQGSAAAAPAASAVPAPPVAVAPPPPAHAASSSQPSTAAPPASGAAQSASQAAAGGDASDYEPAVEPPAAQGSGAAAGTAGGLPLYQQIVSSANLPALHLDLHVFADRPKDRFVMINMHRLGEGDDLPGGVHVDAIRPDGVVLTYQGTRFLLPRN
jgi:general secretion pathway protein B